MKQCSQCNKEFPALYKARTRTHGALCRICWEKIKSRSTGLKTGSTSTSTHRHVRGKAISPISDKKAKELREYRKLRDEYMIANPVCEVCGSRKNLTLHHKKSRQFFLCDVSVFMVACFTCHEKIHREHKWAEENGYIESKL